MFKWGPGAKEVELLDVLDWLHFQGQDDWLDQQWGIPPWTSAREHPEKQPSEKRRKKEEAEALALLEANDALEAAYSRRGPAASNVYGLPRAYRATETGAVLRTQRAALVQSSEAPDEVDLVPAGGILREAGLIPADALEPVEAPEPRDATPPTRIRVPELEIDAEVVALDMDGDGQLPTPSSARVVAWYSYGAPLGEGGNAVLAGHVDWNREPGVFWNLREAQPGQTIILSGSTGRVYEYIVEWARLPGGVARGSPRAAAAPGPDHPHAGHLRRSLRRRDAHLRGPPGGPGHPGRATRLTVLCQAALIRSSPAGVLL